MSAPILTRKNFAYVSDDSKKKNVLKKIVKKLSSTKIYLSEFFSIFIKSSETHFDLVRAKLEQNLNFCRKIYKFHKLKNENFVERRYLKKSENCFCIRFRTLRIIWDQKSNLATFKGEEGGLHVVNKE